MAKLYTQLLAEIERKKELAARMSVAQLWHGKRATAIAQQPKPVIVPKPVTRSTITQTTQDNVSFGSMIMFSYEPKTKSKLPFYDTFPVTFPFGGASGGFLALNMHYLPFAHRAALMDALYTLASTKDVNESTTLQLSYDVLNSVSRFKYFRPCVKHYMHKYVKSRFVLVEPQYWEKALFLPLGQFKKATRDEVYQYSLSRIK